MLNIALTIIAIEILIFITVALALGIFYLVIMTKYEINEYRAKRKGGEQE